MRGMEDLTVIHDKKAPPSPWLLASYRYATRRFNADAIVHVGTHGLVEWSRGKEWSPAAGDYPEFLVDNVPHAYVFNVLDPVEASIARRRSYATILSHLCPPLKSVEGSSDLRSLHRLVHDYYNAQSESRRASRRPGRRDLRSRRAHRLPRRRSRRMRTTAQYVGAVARRARLARRRVRAGRASTSTDATSPKTTGSTRSMPASSLPTWTSIVWSRAATVWTTTRIARDPQALERRRHLPSRHARRDSRRVAHADRERSLAPRRRSRPQRRARASFARARSPDSAMIGESLRSRRAQGVPRSRARAVEATRPRRRRRTRRLADSPRRALSCDPSHGRRDRRRLERAADRAQHGLDRRAHAAARSGAPQGKRTVEQLLENALEPSAALSRTPSASCFGAARCSRAKASASRRRSTCSARASPRISSAEPSAWTHPAGRARAPAHRHPGQHVDRLQEHVPRRDPPDPRSGCPRRRGRRTARDRTS